MASTICSRIWRVKKWIENIKQDIDTRNIQFDEAMAMVQRRVKWRRLIAASSSL